MPFFIGVVLAILGYFLAGAIPIVQQGFVSFLIWEIILFGLASLISYRAGLFTSRP